MFVQFQNEDVSDSKNLRVKLSYCRAEKPYERDTASVCKIGWIVQDVCLYASEDEN